MHHVPGRSLATLLATTPQHAWPWSRVVKIIAQLLLALRVAHEHTSQVIHCDLKPSNIMLVDAHGRYDQVTILDFGISQAMTTVANTTSRYGSPPYMAPEQWLEAPVGPATDLYALGCITFELLTGTPPFRASTLTELGEQHLHAPIPALHAGPSDRPQGLNSWLQSMLAKRPADRPASARESWQRLGALSR